eukprot:SAG11_NODE_9419_length_913_cov_1.598280_1_plen_23_part_10
MRDNQKDVRRQRGLHQFQHPKDI